jgi:cobalt transporter subunit CbtB
MMDTTQPQIGIPVSVDSKRFWPALTATLLGMVILFAVALANSDTIHNAAHDTRHSAAFPCH